MAVLKKPYLLFTTARAGSTPVYEILKSYLAHQHGLVGAHTILNPHFGTYATRQGKLHCDPRKNTFPGFDEERAFRSRARLVKKHHGKIFFRAYPHEIRGEFGLWLLDNYEFIFHERKNKVAQVLSFLISANLQVWYKQEGIVVPRRSLKAKKSDFSAIEGSLYVYEHLRRTLDPKRCFTHEDFLRLKPAAFLRHAGFRGGIDAKKVWLPPKQNVGRKIERFSNPREIKKWYEASWLSDLYPWSDDE
jgi:hypothetical protein